MKTKTVKSTQKKIFQNLFLGVDGGGTKTQIVLIDEDQNIVSEGMSGAANPLRVGVETSISNIISAIDSACDAANKSRSDIVAATLGLAGVRRADIRQRIRERFIKRLNIKQIKVVTDAEIALYGTTLGKDGLVVIAGTGSICLGKNGNGEIAIAGGWGPLAGDEGGGAGIARRALQMVAKASDGRGVPTLLSKSAAEYFRASNVENLIVAIYSPQTDNAKIAGFAKYVVETAQKGDKIALDLLQEAGFELGLAACAVIDKLKMQNRKIPIGYVGSIFKAGELLTKPMMSMVHTSAPKAFLQTPKFIPAHAAAVMALEDFCNGGRR